MSLTGRAVREVGGDRDESKGGELDAAVFYQDIEERRLKEWENYQKSHRSTEDQKKNRAFLDISIDNSLAGRLVVELFDNEVPQTVECFRELVSGCNGVDRSSGIKLDYLRTPITHISGQSGLVLMGDLQSLGASVAPIADENYCRRHDKRGLLTMTSYGPGTSTGAFGITLKPVPELDFTQVVFGRVTDGMLLLDKLEAIETDTSGLPKVPVIISFSGVLTGKKPKGMWSDSSQTG